MIDWKVIKMSDTEDLNDISLGAGNFLFGDHKEMCQRLIDLVRK
ncbi:MAG: hypothetical protein ABJO29_02335 [Yoonia sp.]